MNSYKKNKGRLSKRILCVLIIGAVCSSVTIDFVNAGQGNTNLTEIQQSNVAIQGKIVDSKGEALIGVSVAVKGTTQGAITDIDGNYTITTTSDAQLVFSYVGYQTQTVQVGGKKTINITMTEDSRVMDEVVVIGYGVMKKSDLTGAISSVKSEAIARQPVSNVAQALQGQAPGVIVTSNSGAPGGSVNVRVRGVGTVNDSDPLYVVDGMPVTNIDYLSSSEIQSMEILKDASATAIYGARGANGVVLITTKQGSVGKTVVSLEAYWGASKILNNLDLLSGSEWYDLVTEMNKIKTKPFDLSKVNRDISTNWVDEITRTAPIQNYSVNISGGTADDYRYNTILSYIDQDGTIKKTDFSRISLRQNVEKTIIKKILSFGTNINLSQSKANKILEGSNTVGIVNSAIKLEPVIPVKDEKGNYGWSPFVDYNNPVADIDFTNKSTKISSVIGNIYADLNIMKDLKFKSSFGVDMRRTDDYEFNPVYRVSSYQNNSVSKVTRGYRKFDYYVFENTLSYLKTFGKKHTVNALIGYTREWGRTETLEGNSTNTSNDEPDLHYIDAGLTKGSASGTAYESALMSYLGRIHYDFDDRYMLTASVRRDGSSRFGSNNRYGNFPSVALAWKISNEGFFKSMNLNWISSLKLRAGWGKIGSQSIGNYKYQSLLSSNIQYSYLYGTEEKIHQGLVAVAMGNKDIKWEATETTNFGVDANFLSGRLTFNGEYYYKKTKDMLIAEPIPNYFGFETGPVTNIGSAENKGLEFNIDWRDQAGAFTYNIGFNISTVKNKMLSLGSGLPITGGTIRNGNATLTSVGNPIGAFYGYQTNGLIQTAEQLAEVKKLQPKAELGDVVFVNTNGDKVLNDKDKTIIGNPLPDFIYGINLGGAWKGVDLNLQIGGSYGNDIFNAMRYFTYDQVSSTNKDRDMLNYWTPTNTNTNVPRLANTDTNDNMRISDRYVEDGSYLRLRNIQIGYTLPAYLTKKVYMQKVRVYMTGQNLLTFTKYSGSDPEIGQITSDSYLSRGVDIGTYPQSKTIIGGVSITF